MHRIARRLVVTDRLHAAIRVEPGFIEGVTLVRAAQVNELHIADIDIVVVHEQHMATVLDAGFPVGVSRPVAAHRRIRANEHIARQIGHMNLEIHIDGMVGHQMIMGQRAVQGQRQSITADGGNGALFRLGAFGRRPKHHDLIAGFPALRSRAQGDTASIGRHAITHYGRVRRLDGAMRFEMSVNQNALSNTQRIIVRTGRVVGDHSLILIIPNHDLRMPVSLHGIADAAHAYGTAVRGNQGIDDQAGIAVGLKDQLPIHPQAHQGGIQFLAEAHLVAGMNDGSRALSGNTPVFPGGCIPPAAAGAGFMGDIGIIHQVENQLFFLRHAGLPHGKVLHHARVREDHGQIRHTHQEKNCQEKDSHCSVTRKSRKETVDHATFPASGLNREKINNVTVVNFCPG